MKTVTSADGSRIAYDRSGSGPAVILVGGALGYRKFKKMEELAELLSERCTVINYDRRGRGDSTEEQPFSHTGALDREIEDIAALIDAEGGRASLWGWSSGGALAVRAAGAKIGVERVSVYEVPFMVDPDHDRPTPDYGERLDELVAADDRNGAVRHFMRNSMGIPAPFVAAMRLMPMWKGLKSTAHTLPYDWAALGSRRCTARRSAPRSGPR
jgi:pimeloyl-ACP methyl ester carboxylesterase